MRARARARTRAIRRYSLEALIEVEDGSVCIDGLRVYAGSVRAFVHVRSRAGAGEVEREHLRTIVLARVCVWVLAPV